MKHRRLFRGLLCASLGVAVALSEGCGPLGDCRLCWEEGDGPVCPDSQGIAEGVEKCETCAPDCISWDACEPLWIACSNDS